MGKKYYAAQQPDYGDQIFNALSAQLDVFPRAMEAEKKYRPQMAQLEMDIHRQMAPQIMGMMQDPDPQIQQVGMQLAGQMEAMPDAGMVPATQDQIRGMAYGGAISEERLNNQRLR